MLKPANNHVASTDENQDCRTMYLITLVAKDWWYPSFADGQFHDTLVLGVTLNLILANLSNSKVFWFWLWVGKHQGRDWCSRHHTQWLSQVNASICRSTNRELWRQSKLKTEKWGATWQDFHTWIKGDELAHILKETGNLRLHDQPQR